MKKLSIISIAICILITNSVYALVPEPDVIIYGKVVNRYKGADTIMNEGKLTWTIKARDGDQETYSYETELESLNNGQYSYRLYIPQQVAGDISILPTLEINDLNYSEKTIPLEPQDSQYYIINISIDDYEAQMISSSEKSVHMGQVLRSQNIHIDLMISKSPKDSDNDGLPDLWEEQYGLNINQPDDANTDLDGDGLSNLDEFNLASNPIIDNTIPSLRINEMLIYEQGKTQFRPQILDSDTSSDNIYITFKTIPSNITLKGFQTTSHESGYIFNNNDTVRLEDIEQGKIILIHTPQTTHAWGNPQTPENMLLMLHDLDHDPIQVSLQFKLFMPSATDGSESQTWLDGNVETSMFSYYQVWLNSNMDGYNNSVATEMTFFGRSGNRVEDQLISYGYDGWNPATIQMTQNGLPQGRTAIQMSGSNFLEYYSDNQYMKRSTNKPFSISKDTSMFAVVKAQGADNQVVATDTLSELSITGYAHPSYARRLRYAIEETQVVYGAMPIDTEWGIAGLFREANDCRLEWNGSYNGGRFHHQELTKLSSTYSLGGKVMGSATSSDYHAMDMLKGGIGEVLIFSKPFTYKEKWQIYAYLLGKWFDYVVLDASDMTTDTRLMAASASSMIIDDELKNALSNPGLAENIHYFDELLFYLGNRIPDQTNQYNTFKAANGNDYRYMIIGGPSKDHLVGGWEDDILVAGFGEDHLTGLGGTDHFIVRDQTIVVDFNSNEGDVLDLSYVLHPSEEISIDQYIRLNADKFGTYIYVDANGDKSGYTDAMIFLANVTLHNYDLPQLWADGGIITGGPRPSISLSLEIPAVPETEFSEINAKPYEILLKGIIPNGMLLPISLLGKAEQGTDYHIGIDYYVPELNETTIYETYGNSLPISFNRENNSEPLKIYIFPHKDGITEPSETLSLILRNVPDFYDIDPENAKIDLVLNDGLDQVSIATTVAIANETNESNGEIMISRDGSIDSDLDVKLIVQGTAKMGDDFYYIPSEVTIPKGETELSIPVRPINDYETERDRVIEIFVVADDHYDIKGPASARVTITERQIKPGDLDGNDAVDLRDIIFMLKICTGEKVTHINLDGDLLNDQQINVKDLIYIMKELAK
jgi:hypothetical protein